MECETLFCHNEASARLTVPQLKQRHLVCEKCLAEQITWASHYRKTPGAVRVEQVS